jgi:hypothetical protein
MSKASDYSNLYKLPLGRCAFALRGVEQRAQTVGVTEVATLADRGAAEAEKAMDLVLSFQNANGGQYSPEATAMDVVVDRCLNGIYLYLESQVRVYIDEPPGESAALITRTLFPGKVGEITSLPYPEEHTHINTLLQRTRSAELADHVRSLPELPALLDRLAKRNKEYGEALRSSDDAPSHEEIRKAHDQVQERVVETMNLIHGLYALRWPEKTAERDHLLEPIEKQNTAVGISRRRRRTPTDVDPKTGDELVDPDNPDDPDESDPA